MKAIITTSPLKHDNCKNCISECVHAGKDREFCYRGTSCKKTRPNMKIEREILRKQVAKEILSDIYFNLKISAKENDYYNVLGWIEEIAKEYGVEIEE